MSATSGGSSSFVRLSDNEISKILSIPMSLVSENCSQRDQSAQVQSEQAKNPNVNVSSAGSLCDNTQRNLLHLNKVVTYSMFTFVPNCFWTLACFEIGRVVWLKSVFFTDFEKLIFCYKYFLVAACFG